MKYYEKEHRLQMINNISVPRNYVIGAEDYMLTPMAEKHIKRNKSAISFISKMRTTTNKDFTYEKIDA